MHGTAIKCSLRLEEVSACGSFKMQCLYVAGTMTECPDLGRGVNLWVGSIIGGFSV